MNKLLAFWLLLTCLINTTFAASDKKQLNFITIRFPHAIEQPQELAKALTEYFEAEGYSVDLDSYGKSRKDQMINKFCYDQGEVKFETKISQKLKNDKKAYKKILEHLTTNPIVHITGEEKITVVKAKKYKKGKKPKAKALKIKPIEISFIFPKPCKDKGFKYYQKVMR